MNKKDEIQQNAKFDIRQWCFLYYSILISYAIQPARPNLQNLPKISVYIYI